jgi:hypothetical protein
MELSMAILFPSKLSILVVISIASNAVHPTWSDS